MTRSTDALAAPIRQYRTVGGPVCRLCLEPLGPGEDGLHQACADRIQADLERARISLGPAVLW